ncbi:fructokinase-1-like [Phalaenopsis equestris]|uniref:fructokinase-1-like n=1 Tax=Phalaenopsis equestris TaxID=78828 RepID=UPI0009E33C7D|nr:fructokinase-1-like [Phalaenopsis equestris]
MATSKGNDGIVISFGEMLIDFVPTVSGVSLAEAPEFVKAPGGAPANVSIAVSRLGGSSAFIGKLGDDDFGRMLSGILRDNDVSVAGVRFDGFARTSLSFVTLRADGEREFMFYRHPSADMLLSPAELDLELIRRASIFHFGSISLIAEPCRSAHLTAMLEAKNAGALLSYDPNLRLALWPSADEAKAQMLSIWDQVNIVKISDTELEFLTGKSSVEDDIVMSLWKPAMKLLVVTLGKDGCKYYTKNFLGTVDSIKVKPVDTTGAGDAFVGAMLWGIAKDLSTLKDEKKLKEVLRFANACGAITTTKKGAVPGLPSEAEVLEFLKKA